NNHEVWLHYDDPTHLNGKGHLTSVEDCDGGCEEVASYEYDVMGRAASVTRRALGVDYTVARTYDLLGRPSTIAFPDGEVIGPHAYDSAGHLESIPGYVADMTYDAAGKLTSTTMANGALEWFDYSPSREWLDAATVEDSNGVVV